MAGEEDNLIERITENRQPHYEPYGWHHWPEHPWLAYQFRRGLGETQEGGGTVSEMLPGGEPNDSRRQGELAPRNGCASPTATRQRGAARGTAGHIRTAMNCFLRAADYYRQAEFHLEARRSAAAADIHQDGSVQPRFLALSQSARRGARDSLRDGKTLYAYFVRAPFPGDRLPC